MDKTNLFLLLNSIFFGLITTFYIITASFTGSQFQNVYEEPIIIALILISIPFVSLLISFVSFSLFAKYYITKYINRFATDMVESYIEEINNPVDINFNHC